MSSNEVGEPWVAKAVIKTPLHLMEPVQFPGTSSQLTQEQEKMNTAKKVERPGLGIVAEGLEGFLFCLERQNCVASCLC